MPNYTVVNELKRRDVAFSKIRTERLEGGLVIVRSGRAAGNT